MGKTYEEARAEALADGIPESDLKPEVIKMYGHTFDDPTASLPVNAPAVSDAELKENLSMLQAEAKRNALPAQIMGLIGKVVGGVAGKFGKSIIMLLILTAIGMTGCGSSDQAQRAVSNIERSAEAQDRDYTALVIRLAENNRDRDLASAQEDFDAAVKSITQKIEVTELKPVTVRTVKDGATTETTEMQPTKVLRDSVNPATMQALQNKLLENQMQIQKNFSAVLTRVATISKNAANIKALSEGLQSYFTQKVQAMETAQGATDLMLKYLDAVINKKPLPAIPIDSGQ